MNNYNSNSSSSIWLLLLPFFVCFSFLLFSFLFFSFLFFSFLFFLFFSFLIWWFSLFSRQHPSKQIIVFVYCKPMGDVCVCVCVCVSESGRDECLYCKPMDDVCVDGMTMCTWFHFIFVMCVQSVEPESKTVRIRKSEYFERFCFATCCSKCRTS